MAVPNAPPTLPLVERLARRARLVMLVERLWPSLVLAWTVLAAFVTLAWLGVWLLLPPWAPLVGLALSIAALAYAASSGRRAFGIARSDILLRLDRDSGLPHRPVSSGEDRLAGDHPDGFTLALWNAHRRRIAEAAEQVRVRPPSPRLVDRDRYALRLVALLGLIVAGFVAGPEKDGRLAAAFAWRGAETPSRGFRLDAWIDPPPYTGRPPVLLSGASGPAGVATAALVEAPAGSTVIVRSSGAGDVVVESDGALKPAEPDKAKRPDKAGGGIAEHRLILAGDGRLRVRRDGAPYAAFDLRAIPDHPPTIALVGRPKANLRGSLTLAYKIDDDYGVIGAEADFSQPILHGKPITGHTLVEPPKMTLGLPNGPRGLGQGSTTTDLSDHPWAGAEVTAVLSARDEGGNTGLSPPIMFQLPVRPFRKPLAKALVEQRRDLVLDPDHRAHVGTALEALTVAPELFDVTPSVFLGLKAARTRLAAAKSDADLLGVADLLWSMALAIEDGDLSQAERDLRALQRDLRDAIARHAPPEEIAKLTQALRERLDKMLSEMAQTQKDARPGQTPDRNAKTITPKDLQNLIDRLERSARNGDMADAQSLLDQLQNILENLRSARGDPSDQSGKMSQSMSALDRMMRDQQQLRDQTFQRGNQGRRLRPPDPDDEAQRGEAPQASPDDRGEAEGGSDESNRDLQGRQQALRRQLDDLQKQMRDLGLDSEKGFEDAERAMKDAERALGRGKSGSDQAVEAQGRALQALQQGARGLERQMAQGQGDGQGEQGEDGLGRAGGTGNQTGTDPLGRERDGMLDAQHGLNPGEDLAARARQVLEELRRRLGDQQRPREEQDYLERLLKRY